MLPVVVRAETDKACPAFFRPRNAEAARARPINNTPTPAITNQRWRLAQAKLETSGAGEAAATFGIPGADVLTDSTTGAVTGSVTGNTVSTGAGTGNSTGGVGGGTAAFGSWINSCTGAAKR